MKSACLFAPFSILTLLCSLLHPINSEEFTLTILHTNDVHAHYEPFNKYGTGCSQKNIQENKCYGGFARLATAVEGLRNQYPNTLLLDAGDQAQGTAWYTILQNNVTVHFMNKLKYDAMSIGNHEFDLGDVDTLDFLKRINFKVLGANVNMSEIPAAMAYLLPSTVFTVGGERVGVVGYVTPDTKFISRPGRFKFKDEIPVVRKEVERLKGLGINKIIAVGHSGYKQDLNIAREVAGIDVIVGGHSNTFLYNGEPPTDEDKPEGPYPTLVQQASGAQVAVVQDYFFGKYLGVLHVKFNESGDLTAWSGNPVLLDKNYRDDPDIKADIDEWKQPVEATRQVKVGSTYVLLNRNDCWFGKECIIGNMIADGYVHYFVGRGEGEAWTSVSVSLVNSGSIRNNILQGDITYADVYNIQPFQNTMDVVVLEGRHLREVMELSVGEGYKKAAFLQVSGIRMVFDAGREIGDRITSIRIRCANCSEPKYYPLDDDEEYSVAISDFILNGGDGYYHFKKYAKSHDVVGILDSDLLVAYIRKFSPLTPEEQDRIVQLENLTQGIVNGTINPLLVDNTRPDPPMREKECSCNSAGCMNIGVALIAALLALIYLV